MSGDSSRVVIVDLDEAGGAAGIERIRRACDAESAACVVAVSRDPALARPAMLAGAADFALVPRDCAWLEGVQAAEAARRERSLRASAPESRGYLLIDVPAEGLSYEEYERRIVEHALARAGGNRSRAARELEIGRPRLLRKIARFGLRGPAGPEDDPAA